MLYFQSDYTKGTHPSILQRLIDTNEEALSGYGSDIYTMMAKRKIREAISIPEADIYFISGGTQTNAIVISAMLSSHEGVIAADTGHISIHEAGAIEHTGHKVLALAHTLGKILPSQIKNYIADFYEDENYPHMVFPGMVYLSYPTEYGTLYTKKELEEIASICHTYQIPLFIDGARLGYGLASKSCDIDLPFIAQIADIFYIGGTKVGALCGEAIVFTKQNTPPQFYTHIKLMGALLAKGRLLGVQFDTLFSNELYLTISRHAIDMAEKLIQVLHKHKLDFYLQSPTNQQFIILDNHIYETLSMYVMTSFWEKYDDTHTVVRFATSWATTIEEIQELDKIFEQVL